MRPTRLELSGFTAFREPTVLDFEGCEYFAFCGPTGAGKSSLIDAMCFALYGSVPRLGDKQIAPIISQGMIEATVRLDFTVDGVGYCAMRRVQKTKTGATTPEARLQRGDEVIAGSADGVSREVEKLLGLNFKHFTKCVVLPQGEFAEFLHSTLKERQDLLKQLLDMEIYERMGKMANQIAIAAKSYVQILSRRLEDDLSFATPESRDEHKSRLLQIQQLSATVEQAQPKDQALGRDEERAKEEAIAADARVARLRRITIPDGFAEQADRIASARDLRTVSADELSRAEQQRVAADNAVTALPKRSELELAHQAHSEGATLRRQLETTRATLARLIQNESDAVKEQEAAEERHKSGLDAVEIAKLEHRAHELAATLSEGDACPVCKQVVKEPPQLEAPKDLRAAELALASASRDLESARAARSDAEKKRVAEETRIVLDESRLQTIETRIGSYQDPAVLQSLLDELSLAEKTHDRARKDENTARSKLTEATKHLEAAERAQRDAWKLFDTARDSVSEAEPPTAERLDLASDWAALTRWADDKVGSESESANAARIREREAGERRKALRAELANACRSLSIEPIPSVSQAVMNALAEQQARCQRIDEALVEIENIKSELARADEEQSVASRLGQHLSAKGFEKWLLDEAVRALLEQASQTLLELSGDAYSLQLDDKSNFVVVDHRNAGERRLAKTLSGGETFLASLSLALALSVRLAEIASEGARLDAIFLDEGFGSLDPETLDTVVNAIEGLAAQRMVGLVTHVPSIGERVPVRFDVSKVAGTSQVTRIEN